MPIGMTYISSTTLTSTNTAIDLTSIPSTYTHLYLVGSLRGTENNSTLAFRINNDSANNYAIVQNYTYITSPGTGATRYTIGTTSQVRNNSGHVEDTTRLANLFGQFELYIMDYKSSSYKKSFIFKASHSLNTAQTSMSDVYGVWNDTSAINRITIKGDSGNNLNVGCSVHLYGLG
jgi:hypothetical protein